MIVQSITGLDIDLVRTLQPTDWPNIIPNIEKYIQSSFCYPLKFIDNSLLVGIGALIVHSDSAWLAHIIVHPEHRKKGIGRFIVNTLLQHPEAAKVRTKLLIATSLGEPIYLKAGFNPVSTYLFFKKETSLINYSSVPELCDLKEEHFLQVFEMDKRVSGEDRRRSIENYLLNAKVYVKNDVVRGYFLPDLGEGLIIAEDDAAGLELMKLKYSLTEKAVLPEENSTGVEFLKKAGFVEFSRGRRMAFGQDITWKPQCIYSRIGGNLG